MPYTHIFSTHSMLQEQLTDAIIREEEIDPNEVLVIRVRGSFRPGEQAIYRIVDGGHFGATGGYNIPKHRKRNRAAYNRFEREVLSELSENFQVYSAMYTYWYLVDLKNRADAYHILEDGFGSYQTLAEQQSFFTQMTATSLGQRLATLRRRAAQLPVQRPGKTDFIGLLKNAASFYTTSAECFPWVEPDRKRVLKQPFLPRYVGEYEGATVLGTSCFVESGFFPLSDYLPLLRGVLQRISDRGLTELYVKFHPAQAAHPRNATAYRSVLAEFEGRLHITELPQGTSIESLAAGNRITFITGVSTLAFHVQATGAEVLTYLEAIEKIGPHATSYLAKGGLELFRRITSPL